VIYTTIGKSNYNLLTLNIHSILILTKMTWIVINAIDGLYDVKVELLKVIGLLVLR
jgi:hypothetical protein